MIVHTDSTLVVHASHPTTMQDWILLASSIHWGCAFAYPPHKDIKGRVGLAIPQFLLATRGSKTEPQQCPPASLHTVLDSFVAHWRNTYRNSLIRFCFLPLNPSRSTAPPAHVERLTMSKSKIYRVKNLPFL